MQLNASVSWDGLVLKGERYSAVFPLGAYEAVLGRPSRTVEPAPPAPYGHRNNQIHVFDLGLYLIEHHATALVTSAVFVFDPSECAFPVHGSFDQGLLLGDVRIVPGMRERDYPAGAAITLPRSLPGLYSAERGGIWVGITTKGKRAPSGRRGRERYITDVSVCFSS